MRDLYQVMREKELQIIRIRHEIEALRSVIPLLADDTGELDPASPLHQPLRVVNRD